MDTTIDRIPNFYCSGRAIFRPKKVQKTML